MEDSEEFYRTLCSLETLRSGKKGFFRELSEQATQSAGDPWITKIFSRVEKDQDRLRTIFTDGKVKEVVVETLNRVKTLYRDKDPAVSRSKRLEGFEAALAGEREKALLLFSQAVLRAPVAGKFKEIDQGFSLPLALLARAEIFIATKEYDLALEDLSLAAENNLPDNLRAEVARKKEECERFLGANNASLVPVTEFLEGKDSQRGSRCKPFMPRLSGYENPRLPGASDLLEIRETPEAGKHAVATRDIHPGDVLVVEAPLAGYLLPDFFGTHCQHCFARFRAPIGCSECSSVAFCGRKCRDLAVSTYHKYECKILALLIGSGMSLLSSLALRMVTQEGLKKCLEISRALVQRYPDEMGKNGKPSKENEKAPRANTPDAKTDNEDIKPSRSAKRRMRKKKLRDSRYVGNKEPINGENEMIDTGVYDLIMHETRRSSKDFLERTLMAAFLLKCLQRVEFFDHPTKDGEVPNEDEIAVGALLLKNLQLLQFNAHEFFETRRGTEHRFRGSRPVYLGVAIYPTVARFNHDCYPAVTRYFVGRHIVIRATRNLKPGDVVAENYGPIFTKRTLEERQRTLQGRYWFRCTCRACREDWPCFQTLTNEMVKLRCPAKECSKLHKRTNESGKPIKCSSCQRKVDLREALETLRECEELYAQGFSTMDKQRPEEAIQIFIQGMNKFHEIAEPPHKDTHLAEIALSTCMAASGNTWISSSL